MGSSKAAPRQGGRARPGTLVPAVPIYSIYQDDWKGPQRQFPRSADSDWLLGL